MDPITKELREYVSAVRKYHITDVHGKKREYVDATTRDLLQIADRIDAEHERRMGQSCNEGRIVMCHECAWMGHIGKHPACMVGGRRLVTVGDGCSLGIRKEVAYSGR